MGYCANFGSSVSRQHDDTQGGKKIGPAWKVSVLKELKT